MDTKSSPFNSTRSLTRQTFGCVTRRDRMISRRSVSRRSGDIRSGPDPLHRDVDVEPQVSRAVDDAHAAEAEHLVDPVTVAEERPGLQRPVGAGLVAGLRRPLALA